VNLSGVLVKFPRGHRPESHDAGAPMSSSMIPRLAILVIGRTRRRNGDKADHDDDNELLLRGMNTIPWQVNSSAAKCRKWLLRKSCGAVAGPQRVPANLIKAANYWA
jgi:hypothetical protein